MKHHQKDYYKTLDVRLLPSRDGLRYKIAGPDPVGREPLIGCGGIGQWDRFLVMITATPPIRVGDKLYIYHRGGTSWHKPFSHKDPDEYNFGANGLATLRVDGFASLAATFAGGQFTTRSVVCTGKGLTVNAIANPGKVWVELLDESDVVRGTSNRYLTYFFQRRLALNPTVPLLPGEGTALERVFGRRINPRLTETNPAEADYILVPALEMAEAEEEVAAADAMLNSARIRLWVVQTVTFQLGIGLEAPVLRHVSTTRKLNGPDDGPTDVAVAEDLRSVVRPTWLATYFDREVAKPLVHAAAIVHFWHLFADQIRSEGDFHLIFDAAGFSLKPESALRRIREAFLSQKVCGDRSGGSDYKGDWPQFVECTRAFLRKNGVSLEAA